MSEVVEKRIDEIIDFDNSKTNGSSFTKSYIQEHKGMVPVYGASLDENEVSYGFVEDLLPGVRYFDDCLTWNIDGSTGIFFRKGHFSLSEKVIPLIPFEDVKDSLDLNFLKYAIMYSKEFAEFSFSNKAGKGKLKEIVVKIPVKANGQFDLETQQDLAKKFQDIENKKRLLQNKIENIRKLRIVIEDENDIVFKSVHLTELFTPKGGDMRLSKSWCKEHLGEFPVYSGSTVDEMYSSIDEYKYDGEYLTWVIDGLAGYIMKIKGKFSITCHRGILLPTDACKNVDLQYVKYVLEPIFRSRIRGRIGINGKNEYTALKPKHIEKYDDTIPIPITTDGKFDLGKQQELARKYATIESIKTDLYDKIMELTSIVVY